MAPMPVAPYMPPPPTMSGDAPAPTNPPPPSPTFAPCRDAPPSDACVYSVGHLIAPSSEGECILTNTYVALESTTCNACCQAYKTDTSCSAALRAHSCNRDCAACSAKQAGGLPCAELCDNVQGACPNVLNDCPGLREQVICSQPGTPGCLAGISVSAEAAGSGDSSTADKSAVDSALSSPLLIGIVVAVLCLLCLLIAIGVRQKRRKVVMQGGTIYAPAPHQKQRTMSTGRRSVRAAPTMQLSEAGGTYQNSMFPVHQTAVTTYDSAPDTQYATSQYGAPPTTSQYGNAAGTGTLAAAQYGAPPETSQYGAATEMYGSMQLAPASTAQYAAPPDVSQYGSTK
eukprot:CAMPEP_0170757630 /NCGR_PEP_ID=MMETSP0437-20130122/14627_1 /TAXON_ID=0 /ORGANISM="Sexangularia sp." /LENGTH=342 /DNA_ID=CAMNT_0011096825 /DNA_START=325 /DNA_END=1353 /DNA_ORIENTATION=-